MFLHYEELNFVKKAFQVRYLAIEPCVFSNILHSNNQTGTSHFFLGNILAVVECCICREKKTLGACGYESLRNCTRELAAQLLKYCCMEKQHSLLLFANLTGKEIRCIIAFELHYHQSCYLESKGLLRTLKVRIRLSLIT